jgi:hypothetical protein
MGSEMQPQIMRAQKSEQILILEINKEYWHVLKYQSTISIIWVYSYSYRKFNCEYATHFFFYIS